MIAITYDSKLILSSIKVYGNNLYQRNTLRFEYYDQFVKMLALKWCNDYTLKRLKVGNDSCHILLGIYF